MEAVCDKDRIASRQPFPCTDLLAHSYCADMKVGEWKATLENLDGGTTQDFLLYICERYNITSWGSGHEYSRQFQQLYTTVNGQYMDRNDTKEVYKVCWEVLSACL